MIGMTTSCKSLCKINLFLKITGKREDGYHNIETVFFPLEEPFDEITLDFDSAPGIKIDSDNLSLPLDENNICWKAAESFAKFAEITPAWKISIKKRIPVAAGLGGGSGNAAAVFRLLNEKYDAIDGEKLKDIALKIGADVPYFLNPVPARATGIGENIRPLKVDTPLFFVLVNPKFPVSSKWAYINRISPGGKIPEITGMISALESGNADAIARNMYNELGLALFKKFPALKIIRDTLMEAGALAAEISGSGPTVFAIADSAGKACEIRSKVSSKLGDAALCFSSASASARLWKKCTIRDHSLY